MPQSTKKTLKSRYTYNTAAPLSKQYSDSQVFNGYYLCYDAQSKQSLLLSLFITSNKTQLSSLYKKFISTFSKLKSIKDQNITQLYDVFLHNDDTLALVMQYNQGGSLTDYVGKSFNLDFRLATNIIAKITRALIHLHDLQIVNSFINLQNVQIAKDGTPKLSFKCLIWKTLYLSPQFKKDHVKSKQGDLYCIGVCLYRLIYGMFPFKTKTQKIDELISLVTNGPQLEVQNGQNKFPIIVPNHIGQILLTLLHIDPQIRLSCLQKLLSKQKDLLSSPLRESIYNSYFGDQSAFIALFSVISSSDEYVYTILHPSQKRILSLVILSSSTQKLSKYIKQVVLVYSKLNSQSFIKIYQYQIVQQQYLGIIYSYVTGGNLKEYKEMMGKKLFQKHLTQTTISKVKNALKLLPQSYNYLTNQMIFIKNGEVRIKFPNFKTKNQQLYIKKAIAYSKKQASFIAPQVLTAKVSLNADTWSVGVLEHWMMYNQMPTFDKNGNPMTKNKQSFIKQNPIQSKKSITKNGQLKKNQINDEQAVDIIKPSLNRHLQNYVNQPLSPALKSKVSPTSKGKNSKNKKVQQKNQQNSQISQLQIQKPQKQQNLKLNIDSKAKAYDYINSKGKTSQIQYSNRKANQYENSNKKNNETQNFNRKTRNNEKPNPRINETKLNEHIRENENKNGRVTPKRGSTNRITNSSNKLRTSSIDINEIDEDLNNQPQTINATYKAAPNKFAMKAFNNEPVQSRRQNRRQNQTIRQQNVQQRQPLIKRISQAVIERMRKLGDLQHSYTKSPRVVIKCVIFVLLYLFLFYYNFFTITSSLVSNRSSYMPTTVKIRALPTDPQPNINYTLVTKTPIQTNLLFYNNTLNVLRQQYQCVLNGYSVQSDVVGVIASKGFVAYEVVGLILALIHLVVGCFLISKFDQCKAWAITKFDQSQRYYPLYNWVIVNLALVSLTSMHYLLYGGLYHLDLQPCLSKTSLPGIQFLLKSWVSSWLLRFIWIFIGFIIAYTVLIYLILNPRKALHKYIYITLIILYFIGIIFRFLGKFVDGKENSFGVSGELLQIIVGICMFGVDYLFFCLVKPRHSADTDHADNNASIDQLHKTQEYLFNDDFDIEK